jgi:hypothetical protein
MPLLDVQSAPKLQPIPGLDPVFLKRPWPGVEQVSRLHWRSSFVTALKVVVIRHSCPEGHHSFGSPVRLMAFRWSFAISTTRTA